MDLSGYITLPEAPKTVDPGTGGESVTFSGLPLPVTAPVEPALTPIPSLARDLREIAERTAEEARDLAAQIEAASAASPTFERYRRAVESTRFDALRLLTEDVPDPEPDLVELRAAERDVQRRVTDPRAPFLADVRRMETKASVSALAVARVWSPAEGAGPLWEKLGDSPLTRHFLYKERQILGDLRDSLSSIRSLSLRGLSDAALSGLSRAVLPLPASVQDDRDPDLGEEDMLEAGLPAAVSGEAPARIPDAGPRRALRTLRLLLARSVVGGTALWEGASEILESVAPTRALVGDALAAHQDAALLAGAGDGIETGIDAIAEALRLSGGDADLVDILSLVEAEAFSLRAATEASLLEIERRQIEEREARELRLSVARKAAGSRALSAALTGMFGGLSRTLAPSIGQDPSDLLLWSAYDGLSALARLPETDDPADPALFG